MHPSISTRAAHEYRILEAGKEADLVVLRQDPLQDIRVLQDKSNILLVIKSGEIIVDRRPQPVLSEN